VLRSIPSAVVVGTPLFLLLAASTAPRADASNDTGGWPLRGDLLGWGVDIGSRCSFVSGRRECDGLGSHFCHSFLKGLGTYFGFLCFNRVRRRTKKRRKRPRSTAMTPIMIWTFSLVKVRASSLEGRPTPTYAGAAPLLWDESLAAVVVAAGEDVDVDVGEDVGVEVESPCRRSNSAPGKCILAIKRA